MQPARQVAEARLAKAQQAVDNLNADVATKTKALEDAKTQLATEEAKLAQLKEAKSTSEVVLAEAQSKVEALKAEEAKIADEIAVLKVQLAEQLAKLAKTQKCGPSPFRRSSGACKSYRGSHCR